MVRLPRVSEKEDHQRGKMDMLSMYKATERLAVVGVELRSMVNSGRAARYTVNYLAQRREERGIVKFNIRLLSP